MATEPTTAPTDTPGPSAPPEDTRTPVAPRLDTRWGAPARWLTAVSVAAVLGVNVAGLWEIAVARRGATEEAARLFRLETAGRARVLESMLFKTRADLAFLAGSSAVMRLEGLARAGSGAEDEWRQLAAEAVLVFLRAHPEVAHLTVKSGKGYALVRTARRGGLPVLWSASERQAAAGGGPQMDDAFGNRYLRAEFEFAGSGPDVVRLLAEIEPSVLLAPALTSQGRMRSCVLTDAAGGMLVTRRLAAAEAQAATLAAQASVQTEGWSAPSPWALQCRGDSTPDAQLLPMGRHYRLTLWLNVTAMLATMLLGSFVIQQTRRRERLEARSREQMRIRELERQLFHTERLATVGRLAAGMAHEINNPLEGMSNYLSMAREEVRRGNTEAAARRLDGVQEGMGRIASFVRQVLAHADPASAPASPVDVGALVRETVEFIKARREFGRIVFSIEVARESLPVQGNAVTLGQVLLNIVLNACEAQRDGGEVSVFAGTLREPAAGAPPRVVVEVADRGPGIPPEDLARIFEPFYSTKQSTGLGLAVCHTIVRQHRGEITALNRRGGGALFRITLPAEEP